jgi:hypothetical protein
VTAAGPDGVVAAKFAIGHVPVLALRVAGDRVRA